MWILSKGSLESQFSIRTSTNKRICTAWSHIHLGCSRRFFCKHKASAGSRYVGSVALDSGGFYRTSITSNLITLQAVKSPKTKANVELRIELPPSRSWQDVSLRWSFLSSEMGNNLHGYLLPASQRPVQTAVSITSIAASLHKLKQFVNFDPQTGKQ